MVVGYKRSNNLLTRLMVRSIISFGILSIASVTHAQSNVLSLIAHCESQGRQFDARGGVLRNRQNPRVVGVFQINERSHGASAQKLGLNIYTQEGNWAYARHLLRTQGTTPWAASRHCWRMAQR